MHLLRKAIFLSLMVTSTIDASAQCWPFGRDLTAAELTACFMAEYQRCEELVPGFKSQAAKSIGNLTSNPKYKELEKSKDFGRFRQEAYKNLIATNWNPGNSCKAKLDTLEKGNF